jgi:hypothetical protein
MSNINRISDSLYIIKKAEKVFYNLQDACSNLIDYNEKNLDTYNKKRWIIQASKFCYKHFQGNFPEYILYLTSFIE